MSGTAGEDSFAVMGPCGAYRRRARSRTICSRHCRSASFFRRREAERTDLGRGGPIRRLGRLGVRHMARGVVMAHNTCLLMAALYADEYLAVQIKRAIGRLDLL